MHQQKMNSCDGTGKGRCGQDNPFQQYINSYIFFVLCVRMHMCARVCVFLCVCVERVPKAYKRTFWSGPVQRVPHRLDLI